MARKSAEDRFWLTLISMYISLELLVTALKLDYEFKKIVGSLDISISDVAPVSA